MQREKTSNNAINSDSEKRRVLVAPLAIAGCGGVKVDFSGGSKTSLQRRQLAESSLGGWISYLATYSPMTSTPIHLSTEFKNVRTSGSGLNAVRLAVRAELVEAHSPFDRLRANELKRTVLGQVFQSSISIYRFCRFLSFYLFLSDSATRHSLLTSWRCMPGTPHWHWAVGLSVLSGAGCNIVSGILRFSTGGGNSRVVG